MPSREDVLRDQTFKEEFTELDRRVFDTLTFCNSKEKHLNITDDYIKIHRIAKATSQIIKLLHEKGLLDNKEIDELLLEVVH